jgi:hypothetical protein
VVGLADMDNNGVPDIVWQEDTTRSVGTWYMSGPRGTNLLEIQYQQPNSYPGWTIVGVADYDGNGVQDLIWQNDSTRVLGIWYMGGAKAMTKLSENMQLAAPEPGWRAVMPRVTAWTASPPQQQYHLTTSVNGAGTIEPASGWYDNGTVVTVTATPNSGYQFAGFTGALNGMTNPQSLTVTSDLSVTANFQTIGPAPDFTIASKTGSRILTAGRSSQYLVVVQPVNGFAGPVTFSASGLPNGATATFSPASVAGQGSTTLTVTTTPGSVTNGPVSIMITGTSGAINRSVPAYLTVNPSGYSIYPVALEVNLSAIPIDRYLLPNNDGSGAPILSNCPVTRTIRQCIARLLNNDPTNPIAQGPNGVPVEWNNWIAQGVTGVRFFYGIAGGFFSTPYLPNIPPYSSANPTIRSGMHPEAAWTSNLNAFFQDLKTYGVQKVTPTPVFDVWGWPHGWIEVANLPRCGSATDRYTLFFLPGLPFGHSLEGGELYPDRECADQSYQNGQSPATPDYIFWGWDRFFNLISEVVSKAAANQLVINALDYYQETNMASFTVQARMIYDNTRNVDVVAGLQDHMNWYRNNVPGGIGIDPLGASPSANGPEVPSPVNGDCSSLHYGGSGQFTTLSALAAAIRGDKAIGQPGYDWSVGLPCGPLSSGGTMVPTGRRLFPSYVDIHTQKHFAALIDMSEWSKNFHSRLYEFVATPNSGLYGKRVVFGETNPIDSGCNSPWTKEQAQSMLYGTPGWSNGFVNSSLFTYYSSYLVMRPWQDITHAHSGCMEMPNTLNPPFNSIW